MKSNHNNQIEQDNKQKEHNMETQSTWRPKHKLFKKKSAKNGTFKKMVNVKDIHNSN
jgi:hypothetical protein